MSEYTENVAFIDLKAQLSAIRNKINLAIAKVLDHGQFIMGPEVHELEEKLKDFSGANYALTCANGTDALTLALLALNIDRGDIVFVPSFTYVASAEAVALIGAIPFLVDVDPVNFNICPKSLEKAILHAQSQGYNVKAVISVELFGNPCDYSVLDPLVEKYRLKLIIDAAQSFGAEFNNMKTAAKGDIVTTSFFPAKPLGCYGDGGALFTNSEELRNRLNSLRLHGKGTNKYDNVMVGMNSRLDTIQAAILIEKLKIFPSELFYRQHIADKYNSVLSSVIETPIIDVRNKSTWAQYTVKSKERDILRRKLSEKGIPTVVYYPMCLSKQKGYQQFPKLPEGTINSEKISGEVLSLPMNPYLNVDQIALKIYEVVKELK